MERGPETRGSGIRVVSGSPIDVTIQPDEKKETTMSTDPVCGMMVDEKAAPASTKYAGKTIYFCSTECKDQFYQNPEVYVAETGKDHMS